MQHANKMIAGTARGPVNRLINHFDSFLKGHFTCYCDRHGVFLTTRIGLCAGLLAAVFLTPVASAQMAEALLLARSSPSDGYRMPADTGFANNTVALNNNGRVSLQLGSLPPIGERGIWIGDADAGGVVVTGDPDWLFSDTGINDAGQVVWVRSFSPANGIYGYDPVNMTSQLLTTEPFGASSWGNPDINNNDELGFRASFASGQVWASWTASGGDELHAVETALDGTSPYAFLFTPAFNNQREIAGKVRLNGLNEDDPDQIIRAGTGQTITVIVEDDDSLPGSPFTRFDNSVGFNDNGDVAFVTTLANPSVRAVFRTVNGVPEEMARVGSDGIADIEFFGVRLNNAGQVVFRAIDDSGRRAIWMNDGSGVQRLIGQDDLVMTDVGMARIANPAGGPVFSGGIDLNDNGAVAFVAVLSQPDSGQLVGLGIFTLSPPTEVILQDSFESI